MAFIAVLLVLLPSPWHWRARNVATLSLIAWLALTNFARGVNAIVWMGNVRIHSRWWCDITSKITIGIGVALPACSFCITRNLEQIASSRVVVVTAADRKRRRILEASVTIGLPVVIMTLHYIVQGHRFDIVEDLGCNPSVYVSIPSLFILVVPPLLLSVGSLIQAALALRHFVLRRAAFEKHLRDSESSLNTSRYMRLMALAISEMLWGTTLGSYITFTNIKQSGLRPWTSWESVHYNFSRIALFPTFVLTKWQRNNLLLSWWISPATALLFFLFLGLSEEAIEGYTRALRRMRRIVLRKRENTTTEESSSDPRATGIYPLKTRRTNGSSLDPDDLQINFVDAKIFDESSGGISFSLPGHRRPLAAPEP